MRVFQYVCGVANLSRRKHLPVSSVVETVKLGFLRSYSMFTECPETREVVEYLDNLKNYEKSGVPDNAGTDSSDGFDLGRMRRLMNRLGNPQSKYKVVHVAGTKGKGSTAAFLSNILRAEGYSVGCYTSPHIRTIRERMSVGTRVIEAGLGGARDATNVISDSELAAAVITTIGKEHLAALGGSLESIALAKSGIIKQGCPVVLGGPFLPHIEKIIRDRALSMCSPVVSASDSGNRSRINELTEVREELRQSCDILLQIEKDIPLSINLHDVNLSMLGLHQLQNAVTATCAALCLRELGWKISDVSIRSALESTKLLRRSQFLRKEERDALGLHGSMTLLDGAHTLESAKALVDTISTVCQGSRLVLVVAMASDKDHFSFARELLTGLQIEAVFLTEANIAGDKSRTASALFLKNIWTKACTELGVEFVQEDVANNLQSLDASDPTTGDSGKIILAAEGSLLNCLRAGKKLLQVRTGNKSGIIIVTGSLHAASSVLDSIYG